MNAILLHSDHCADISSVTILNHSSPHERSMYITPQNHTSGDSF